MRGPGDNPELELAISQAIRTIDVSSGGTKERHEAELTRDDFIRYQVAAACGEETLTAANRRLGERIRDWNAQQRFSLGIWGWMEMQIDHRTSILSHVMDISYNYARDRYVLPAMRRELAEALDRPEILDDSNEFFRQEVARLRLEEQQEMRSRS